jgi:hypothetical protein
MFDVVGSLPFYCTVRMYVLCTGTVASYLVQYLAMHDCVAAYFATTFVPLIFYMYVGSNVVNISVYHTCTDGVVL